MKDMSEDQFTKLFKYMESFRSEVNDRFDEVDKKIDDIYKILDAHLKKIEDILTENTARDQQYKRMERWIHQLAEHSGVKLDYS